MKIAGVLKDRYEVLQVQREEQGYSVYKGRDIKQNMDLVLVFYDSRQAPHNIVADLAFWLSYAEKPLLSILDQWLEWSGQMLAFSSFDGISAYRMAEFSQFPYSDEALIPLIPRFLKLCESLQKLQVVVSTPDEVLHRLMMSSGGEFCIFPLALVDAQEMRVGAAPFYHSTSAPDVSRYLELFGSLCGYFATKKLPSEGLVYNVSESRHLTAELRSVIVGCMEKYRSFGELRKDLSRLVRLPK